MIWWNLQPKKQTYTVYKNIENVLTQCVKEIEQIMGMYLKLGIVQMPGVRYHWQLDTRYGPIADVMSRNRFQAPLTKLHFVNNQEVNDANKTHKL